MFRTAVHSLLHGFTYYNRCIYLMQGWVGLDNVSLIDLDFGKRFSVIILYIHNSMYEKVASLFWSKACATRLSENLWYHEIMFVVFCKTILQILPSRNKDSAFSLVVIVLAAFSGTYTKTLVMTKCNFEKFQVFVVLFDLSNYKISLLI